MPTANQPPPVTDAEIVLSLAFPYQLGVSGFPQLADPAKVAFYHIVALLLTGKNEKVMNPGFGVNIHGYVFDDLSAITMARISTVVSGAIEEWIPEVQVLRVIPKIEKNEDGTQSTIILDIQYRLANQSAQMQVPIPVGSI
jgi:phage baseplate assembly protein W